MKRLFLIGFIWSCCAVAWLALGATIIQRTGEGSSELTSQVQQLWGPARQQAPPSAHYVELRKVKETVNLTDAAGRPTVSIIEREQGFEVPISLEATDAGAKLALEHRRKGLLWFPTYEVDFRARYRFRNSSEQPRAITFGFPLESGNGVYDGFEILGEDGKPIETSIDGNGASWTRQLRAGESASLTVAYRSRGTSTWSYGMPGRGLAGAEGRARDFRLTVETNFAAVDFPAGTLSPSVHAPTPGGWSGTWRFASIVTRSAIGVELPQKLNPGPLASRITFFAPVGLLFFFFVVAVLAMARGKNIHPMNYFFFGCAFFAFHLLFAYLVDHVAILAAFAISSTASTFLVVTYARLFVGWRFALREMALAQMIYLVLFSFTFLWQGFTGLAITVGAVATLFVMMQITGRLDWKREGSAGELSAPPRA